MRNPEFLIYDEATCGVDLIMRLKLKKLLDSLKKRNNLASIFTTHFLKDIEIFCDNINVIKDGRFLFTDSIDTLKTEVGGYVIEI